MSDASPPSSGAPVRRRATTRLGNRLLTATGLASAVAAVACLAALQTGTTPKSSSDSAQLSASTAAAKAERTAAVNAVNAADSANAANARTGAANAVPAASSSSAVKVTISNYAFSPKSLTVSVGTTVTWTNEDSVPHTVTVTSGPVKFDSGLLQKGQSWSYTFRTAGSYSYYCSVHPDMTGSVAVTPVSTPTPTTAPTPSPTPSAGSSPTATPTGGMPGMGGTPTPTSGGGNCYSVQQVLLPLIQHIDSAHLSESLGQQLQDALNLDQYIQTHTVLIENMLNPAVAGGTSVVTSTLTVLMQHIDNAHLSESLGQQLQDLLNPNQYVLTHTVWAEALLSPTVNYLTANC
jgi:plastocyanin